MRFLEMNARRGVWTSRRERVQYFVMDYGEDFMKDLLGSRLPITDGDQGADLYGYAESAERAIAACADIFSDPIDRAERMGPVTLRTGEVLPEAWVVITAPCAAALATE